MFVNTQKTKVIIFGNRDKILISKYDNVKLFDQSLEYVTECKYLGIIIDDQLKFSKHAEYIMGKINKKLNYFNRISVNLLMYSRITVYKTIIAPYFEYCPTILYYCNEGEKQALQKLQNRAMRIILKVNRYTHITSMLECLKVMSINQRLVFNNILFIYKIIHNMLPKYLSKRIRLVSDIHNYNTRTYNGIYVHVHKQEGLHSIHPALGE